MARTTTKLWDGTKHLGYFHGPGTRFEVHHCGTCGTLFAITEQHNDELRESHKGFWCPGCDTVFTYRGESEKERLRRELEAQRDARMRAERRAESTKDLLRHEERSHAATRGHLTRTKKQRDRMHEMIVAGQCPVPGCHRHFKNVKAHIARVHPDFSIEE